MFDRNGWIFALSPNRSLLLFILFLFGCESPTTEQQSGFTAEECLNSGYVCIRVRNTSDFHFRSFNVGFPNQSIEYGNVDPGATSAYQITDRAYRYAYTEAFSGLRKFLLVPNDYVGERYLPPGIYTYEYLAVPHPKFTVGSIFRGNMNMKLQVDSNEPKDRSL